MWCLWFRWRAVSFRSLNLKLELMMSRISEFSDAVNAHFARQSEAITGIKNDIDALKAQIEALQNSQGELSPEDQALLDDIQGKASALADSAGALDAETPPPAPPPEG